MQPQTSPYPSTSSPGVRRATFTSLHAPLLSPQKHRQDHAHRTHANTLTRHIYSHRQASMHRHKHPRAQKTRTHAHTCTPPPRLQPPRVSTYRQRPHTQSTERPAEGRIKEAAGSVKTGWGIRQNKKEPLPKRPTPRSGEKGP